MKKNMFFVMLALFLLAGAAAGAFLFPPDLKASPPFDDPDRENIYPSAYYDEKWVAVEVCVTTPRGVVCDAPQNLEGASAGAVEHETVTKDGISLTIPYLKLAPKIRVAKWRVYGHIHFP